MVTHIQGDDERDDLIQELARILARVFPLNVRMQHVQEHGVERRLTGTRRGAQADSIYFWQ